MLTDSAPQQNARLSQRIHDFFYQEEVPYALALVRIVMPLVLFSVMAPRWFNAREMYSADGAPCPLAFVYGWPDLLPTFSGEVVVLLHSVLLFALVASSIGWCTRLSLGISTVLYIYLNMLDSVSTMTKYSVIASHVLLLLTLSRCGSVWSVDSLLKGSPREKTALWPQRLIQLLIGIVYFGAAITKMHTPEFFSGDQMTFWMLSHVNFANPGGELLSQYPWIVVASAYIVIVWEVIFVFLAWRGLGRILMISLGLVFHLATLITLGLYVFPMVCATIYLSFLRQEDIERYAVRFRRFQKAWKLPTWSRQKTDEPAQGKSNKFAYSRMAYAGLFLAVGAAGVGLEYLQDPYGIRRPEGRYTLKPISPEAAALWLKRSEPIVPEDKVFSFDIGTVVVGDSLANRQRVYEHGDVLVAQVSLNPPHEDMYFECKLHDNENRVVERLAHVIPRERFRAHFSYQLSKAIPAGEYQVVLTTAGKEVGRRMFHIKGEKTAPDPRTASAN